MSIYYTHHIYNNVKMLEEETLINYINELQLKIKQNAEHIVYYLYNNIDDKDNFVHKMYDILYALDIPDNNTIHELLNDVDKLLVCSTYDMCPSINSWVFKEIHERNESSKLDLKQYSTEFTCRKCKHNKTTVAFINKHISNDEASSLKITCINCGHEWYN